jgi:hypothetical protein
VHILGYFILVFGVIGIMLGLYGLLMPIARRRGLTFSLPHIRRPFSSQPAEYDALDDVLLDLESTGFRNSSFEAPTPSEAPPLEPPDQAAPRVVQVTSWVAPASAPPPDSDATLPPLETADAVDIPDATDTLMDDIPNLDAASLPESVQNTVEVTAQYEEPPGDGKGEGLDLDMMALFSGGEVEPALPEALRDAFPEVTMDELLADARSLRQLLSGSGNSQNTAA